MRYWKTQWSGEVKTREAVGLFWKGEQAKKESENAIQCDWHGVTGWKFRKCYSDVQQYKTKKCWNLRLFVFGNQSHPFPPDTPGLSMWNQFLKRPYRKNDDKRQEIDTIRLEPGEYTCIHKLSWKKHRMKETVRPVLTWGDFTAIIFLSSGC